MRKLMVLWVLLMLAACSQQPDSDVITIGVLGDLSGDYANVLRGTHLGAVTAVSDAEAATGKTVRLIVEDQKSCDTKETVTIMNKFINIDKVDVIVGGTCSSTTLAAAPIATAAKVSMISPSSSAPSISGSGEYVFRTYISDILRASEGAKLAYELGKMNMAVMTEINNDAAVEISTGAQEAFKGLSGHVLINEEVDKTTTEFRTQLTKIKATNPDVLLIAVTGPNQIALIAKQARELGIDVQLMVPFETAESSEVPDVGGDAVEDLIYIMPGNPPESEQYLRFAAMYEKANGDKVPSFAAESYDAAMLGALAVAASDGSRESIRDKLHEVSQSYNGVSGSVAFDENGDVFKPVLFKTIKDGEFVVYE